MRCSSPRTVGYQADGQSLAWSSKQFSKEYATFQLPCGKCLECRLDYAKQWAVRCIHEAQMHSRNCFITLTYSDKNLKNPKLDYRDFQLFMKKLRKLQDEPIGFFATGEYGEKTRRKHWHAIVFNWYPSDATYRRSNDRGDEAFKSDTLNNIWGLGHTEVGSVTFESAGYCARYAAKKLGHGWDQDHDFQPISKKSSKHAIGKKWLEKYWWTDCFAHGQIELPDGRGTVSIPRYYERWLKDNYPTEWLAYVTSKKQERIDSAAERVERETQEEEIANHARRLKAARIRSYVPPQRSQNEAKKLILRQKFSQLVDKEKF